MLAVAASVKPYALAWFIPAIGYGGWAVAAVLAAASAVLWSPLLLWGPATFGRSMTLVGDLHPEQANALNLPVLRWLAVPLELAGAFVRRWDAMVLLGSAVFCVFLFLDRWASLGYWLAVLPAAGIAIESRWSAPNAGSLWLGDRTNRVETLAGASVFPGASLERARLTGPPRDRSARWAAGMIAIFILGVAPSLGQTLLETHAHRQTQTAYTALLYAENGIDLMRPPLPILGPPGSIPQELPLVQAAGAILIDAGIGADLAMRLVGLATFVASAVLLYLLARRLMGSLGALVALGAFLFNGHAWLYARTSLIEYAATAGSLAFLYFAIRWMDGGRPATWVLATVGGMVGILAKITTGGFYLLPALLWRSPGGRWGFQRPWLWMSVIASVAIGLAWSAWAQGVREETPASGFLSMQNQLEWFFGSPGQRFDLRSWRVPLVAILTLTGFGVVLWGPLAVARARSSPQAALPAGAARPGRGGPPSPLQPLCHPRLLLGRRRADHRARNRPRR